jgi:hypothetical protein
MAAGDKWELPGGHKALEVAGSTASTLVVCIIPDPPWPFPKPPQMVARNLCKKLPSRYGGGSDDEALM